MHWKELRGFFFPIFMEEINKVKTKYLNLIQQIQKTNQEKDRKLYIELRKSIEARIIEIDEFIEENFDKQFVLHFEKGKLKLKKLLQITPREKLTKQALSKNFKDIDVLNKVLKKQQEKSREIEKEKLNIPIYNKLPVDYELYENLIESMKYEELKNKIIIIKIVNIEIILFQMILNHKNFHIMILILLKIKDCHLDKTIIS